MNRLYAFQSVKASSEQQNHKQKECLPFRIKVFRRKLVQLLKITQIVAFSRDREAAVFWFHEWRFKPSVLVQTERKKTQIISLQHKQNIEKNQTGRRRRRVRAALGGTQKEAELKGGHMVYLQILETTNHLHSKRQKKQTKKTSRCLTSSCSSPKGLFYIFKIHFKASDYQQYNADRSVKHIAQPDFIFFIINSANSFRFSRNVLEPQSDKSLYSEPPK